VTVVDILTAPPRVRRPAVTLWLLRAGLTAHVLAAALQPVLAGMFLTGDVDAIEAHGLTATALGLVCLTCAGISVGYVTAGRGRIWVLPALLALFTVETGQIIVGYLRVLQVHIPGGVTIIVASVLLAIWVWTPSAARPRRPRGAR
jgi:hypothetical protein